MVEDSAHNPKAEGSNPATSTTRERIMLKEVLKQSTYFGATVLAGNDPAADASSFSIDIIDDVGADDATADGADNGNGSVDDPFIQGC